MDFRAFTRVKVKIQFWTLDHYLCYAELSLAPDAAQLLIATGGPELRGR
jgi:hypothetical protein